MPGKQHSGFKCRLLAILFLFFNCVCVAAPAVKATLNDDGVDFLQLTQTPNQPETEEENHLVKSKFITQYRHFSLQKQHSNRLFNIGHKSNAPAATDVKLSQPSLQASLPRPAYYAFLFRYNLF